ncbi:hypothetical protein [Streptomyces jumonjinensis]|uniref:hypothetical protein n=1 Tax=Streptomyces jumonjinensis TaxID=1945 RepID=UPI0037A68D54
MDSHTPDRLLTAGLAALQAAGHNVHAFDADTVEHSLRITLPEGSGSTYLDVDRHTDGCIRFHHSGGETAIGVTERPYPSPDTSRDLVEEVERCLRKPRG